MLYYNIFKTSYILWKPLFTKRTWRRKKATSSLNWRYSSSSRLASSPTRSLESPGLKVAKSCTRHILTIKTDHHLFRTYSYFIHSETERFCFKWCTAPNLILIPPAPTCCSYHWFTEGYILPLWISSAKDTNVYPLLTRSNKNYWYHL